MTFAPSLTFSFLVAVFLSSCAKEELVAEEPASTPAPFAAPGIDQEGLSEASPIQNLGFADPNTTAKLITAEETKTFLGDNPTKDPEEALDDNVVNVAPPSLPDTQLPDPSSN